MINAFFQQGEPVFRVWVISDLQQVIPEMAEDCLRRALEDVRELGGAFSSIWYLGDAMEGKEIGRVEEMTAMQVRLLGDIGVPVRFIMGNHDLDCSTALPVGSSPVLPVWEAFRKVPGWRTTASYSDFYFTEVYGEALVVFLSDHVAPDLRWIATQQEVRGAEPGSYSISVEAYQRLHAEMAAWKGPVILAGHYAFPGGARGAPEDGLLTRLLPLPDSVKLILHGHAHTGDWPYGREKTYQRIGWVDWHPVPQVNVSSLDRTRGSQTRSVILDFYANGSLGLFFRDHEDKIWSDAFFLDTRAPRTRSEASERHHGRRTRFDGTALERWRKQQPSH